MRRIALIALMLLAAAAGVTQVAGADDSHTYKVEMYNAFGLVKGSDVRIAGVNAGSVQDLEITPEKRALLTIQTSGPLGVLGRDTRCASEPQSLIAEYFLTCSPKGPALPDGGTIPASHVRQTVQSDLVADTLREPFKDRLALIINEFGTALAGNPHDLNQAIRLGAPALTQLRKALDILASENRTIRDLNSNSDRIISQLAARKEDVISFIQRARDTAAISATRRADLSRGFNRLDDFLHQLHPTLVKLGDVAEQQKPLLSDLHRAAPGLNTLATNLPPFNKATERSVDALGRASVPGKEALKKGKDEIQTLANSGRHAFSVADTLDKFLLDIDSPKRQVEIDSRAANSCPSGLANAKTHPCYSTGRSSPTGYTGMESLLNYVYYQTGAINQYDEVGHLLHFSLFGPPTGGLGPCQSYNAGGAKPGEPGFGVPDQSGLGTTTSLAAAHRCVAWLGPNQPGINQEPGLNQISRYDGPSVCPQGSLDTRLCDPSIQANNRAPRISKSSGSASASSSQAPGTSAPSNGGGSQKPIAPGLPPSSLPGNPNDLPQNLQDLLGLNHKGLPQQGGGKNAGRHQSGGGAGGLGGSTGQAANDLLDFLFQP